MEKIIKILSAAIGSRMLSSNERQAFDEGLNILSANGVASSFVADARRYRDYHRRVRQLLNLLQTSNITVSVSTEGRRHVGRPSKEEQIARQEAQKRKVIEEAKNSLFPEVEPNLNVQPLTYNGIVANPDGESIAASMPHLTELRPFLSKELQERVNTVRDLRNEMAAKAEQAKTMTEANERATAVSGASAPVYSEKEIATLTTRAVEIESHILPDIYVAVDREIGECYLRLSLKNGDPEYIKHIEKVCNISPKDLRTTFKPFYEKALERDPRFADAIAEKIANDRPEVKAARDAAAKRKAEADALIKYITRKDKPNTKKRIKGLTERIARLRSEYSDIVSADEIAGFEALLASAQSSL